MPPEVAAFMAAAGVGRRARTACCAAGNRVALRVSYAESQAILPVSSRTLGSRALSATTTVGGRAE